ncbi:hypothetical protein PF010_g19782 [Phytophthora fragariae]|nr:hypothetical protein PF010_g19782 [Phytophthora fragariae]KAE9087528.1 hypothetical protein PF007_g20345 [Phytophthora fragariae]KAE9199842.1 hypothetical protein PF004_g19163 [Phytophthora fragariae]KAE9201074.1 hypothetical protein PF002_g21645 [Phytophthora fragariae]
MVLVIDARKAMPVVKATLEWIEKLVMPSDELRPPFNDCMEIPKLMVNRLRECVFSSFVLRSGWDRLA